MLFLLNKETQGEIDMSDKPKDILDKLNKEENPTETSQTKKKGFIVTNRISESKNTDFGFHTVMRKMTSQDFEKRSGSDLYSIPSEIDEE